MDPTEEYVTPEPAGMGVLSIAFRVARNAGRLQYQANRQVVNSCGIVQKAAVATAPTVKTDRERLDATIYLIGQNSTLTTSNRVRSNDSIERNPHLRIVFTAPAQLLTWKAATAVAGIPLP